MKVDRQLTQPSLDPVYQQLWKVDAPPKIRHFLWRCLSNSIAVSGNLAKRHLTREEGCCRCMGIETVNHLMFTCPFARLVWAVSPIPAPEGGEWVDSFYTNLYGILTPGNYPREQQQQMVLAPSLLWRMWKNRNDLIFKGRELGAEKWWPEQRRMWKNGIKGRREHGYQSCHRYPPSAMISGSNPHSHG